MGQAATEDDTYRITVGSLHIRRRNQGCPDPHCFAGITWEEDHHQNCDGSCENCPVQVQDLCDWEGHQ